MVACAIEAIAEAAALLRKYRMSAPDVLDVIILAVQRPGLSGLRPRIAHQQYVPPGFDLVLGMKDVGLALKAGEQADVPLPFASVLRDAFIDAIANGDADKDWSAIARVAARKAGLEDEPTATRCPRHHRFFQGVKPMFEIMTVRRWCTAAALALVAGIAGAALRVPPIRSRSAFPCR